MCGCALMPQSPSSPASITKKTIIVIVKVELDYQADVHTGLINLREAHKLNELYSAVCA